MHVFHKGTSTKVKNSRVDLDKDMFDPNVCPGVYLFFGKIESAINYNKYNSGSTEEDNANKYVYQNRVEFIS